MNSEKRLSLNMVRKFFITNSSQLKPNKIAKLRFTLLMKGNAGLTSKTPLVVDSGASMQMLSKKRFELRSTGDSAEIQVPQRW